MRIKVLNTTTGYSKTCETFKEAFLWGIKHLPDPDTCDGYEKEFLDNGRTAFDDQMEQCYAETIEIWDADKIGEEYEEW